MADEQVKSDAAPEKTADATGAEGQNGGEAGEPERKFTQADMEKQIGERLERERKKAASDAEKARKEAAEKTLREQGDWQKLADERGAEVAKLRETADQLPAVQEERDRYRTALEGHLATQRKGLPKHLIELLDKQDPVDQLTWLAQHADEVGKAGQATNGTPNRGSLSRSSRSEPATETGDPMVNELLATRRYTHF